MATFFFCLAIAGPALAKDREFPEVTVDGLHQVAGTQMGYVYAKPLVDLSQYQRILLLKPQVRFTKNWLQAQNSIPSQTVTAEDMERIKSDLANLFHEVFREELQTNGGYKLVDDLAEDVLIVRPAIVHLDVVAPDTPRTRGTRSAIASAGSMTLYMELLDSVTGDMLVKAMDYKYDRTPYPHRF